MKRTISLYLSGIFMLCTVAAVAIDTSSFYKALASGEEATIDQMLAKLEGEKKTSKTNAYIGVLTMKKSGFVKGVNGKLKTFKKGAHILEDEIKANPGNAEFRSLRLTIQEHAPNILKYNKQIDEDKQAIVSNFGKLNGELKKVITDYARDSDVLKPSDLK